MNDIMEMPFFNKGGSSNSVENMSNAEIVDMTLKWINSGYRNPDEENEEIFNASNIYDFVNLFKVDLSDSNFIFSNYEKTIIDEYTTMFKRFMWNNTYGDPFLEKVVMPNLRDIKGLSFYNCSAMTYCELGQITSTSANSFQGCTALETFKCKAGTTGSIYLQYSDNLSVESLEGIIDNYADMTGAETAPLLYIGETNISKLSEEYITKAQLKNIELKWGAKMLAVRNSNLTIPNITHADAYLNENNAVILDMDDGYVFWDKKDYTYNGVYEEPAPEDILYSRWASLSATRDFSLLIEVTESEVPSNQIFGTGNKTVTEW